MKKLLFAILICGSFSTLYAQTEQPVDTTNQYTLINTVIEEERIASNDHQVISNKFGDNWFVHADVGVNSFWGDYNKKSKFGARLTPQFNIGAGKWFLPGYGVKVQFTGFGSRAQKWVEGDYTYGEALKDADGNSYWEEHIKWFNVNVDFMLNLSRLIKGYEGDDSNKLMNQFYLTAGLGSTFPILEKGGSDNDFALHLELQYSRFFSEKKNFSLDVKLRGILQTTQFDGVCEQFLDDNYSLNVGMTYYFKERGWKRSVSNTTYYVEDYRKINQLNNQIDSLKNIPVPVPVVVVKEVVPELITFPYLVNFVIDKVEVVNRERVNLRVVAEMMKATPDQKYLICGYADKYTGSVKRNLWLGENRAKNVFEVLTKEFGVPESQLVLDDKGGVDNMFYDDPQLSRSAIITRYEE